MAECNSLRVVRLTKDAMLPKSRTSGAAGYDLFSTRNYTIPPYGKVLIDTELSIQIPPTSYGRIAPRSGLAAKHFIGVGAGVIDSDYRGNVYVLLFNFNTISYKVNKYDSIAQLIIENISRPSVVECSTL